MFRVLNKVFGGGVQPFQMQTSFGDMVCSANRRMEAMETAENSEHSVPVHFDTMKIEAKKRARQPYVPRRGAPGMAVFGKYKERAETHRISYNFTKLPANLPINTPLSQLPPSYVNWDTEKQMPRRLDVTHVVYWGSQRLPTAPNTLREPLIHIEIGVGILTLPLAPTALRYGSFINSTKRLELPEGLFAMCDFTFALKLTDGLFCDPAIIDVMIPFNNQTVVADSIEEIQTSESESCGIWEFDKEESRITDMREIRDAWGDGDEDELKRFMAEKDYVIFGENEWSRNDVFGYDPADPGPDAVRRLYDGKLVEYAGDEVPAYVHKYLRVKDVQETKKRLQAKLKPSGLHKFAGLPEYINVGGERRVPEALVTFEMVLRTLDGWPIEMKKRYFLNRYFKDIVVSGFQIGFYCESKDSPSDSESFSVGQLSSDDESTPDADAVADSVVSSDDESTPDADAVADSVDEMISDARGSVDGPD
jgi:hypothetical protein